MRRLARSRLPGLRGSAHALRSAYNHFVLVEPFPNGSLYFKRVVDRPVCVYVVADKLFVLATEPQIFQLERTSDGVLCHLRSAYGGYLFSLGFREDEDVFRPAANRTVADTWEMFELRAPPKLDRRERQAIAGIDRLIDRLGDAPSLGKLENEIEIELAALGACLAGVPRVDEQESTAQPAGRLSARALVEAYPSDLHARAFHDLVENTQFKGEIALGELWRAGLDGGIPSLPFGINCQARQLRRPKKKVCVLATLRNEAPYIVEWLAYHRSIGIDRFFLYENDSQDGSRELLDRLAGHGLVDPVRNVVAEGGNAQSSAYAHALSFRPELLDYEWCAIIDLDEFLLLNEKHYASIEDFLEPFSSVEADAIAVNWIVYGPDGRLRRDQNRPVMDTFTWRHPTPDRHIKSIVKPNKFFSSCAHYPYRYRNRHFAFVDTLGRPHLPLEGEVAWSARPDESRAGLAHYVYKSVDEFLLKWSRNRGDNPRQLAPTNHVLTQAALEAFVRIFHERGAQTPEMNARLLKADAEARRIRALPGIATIELEIDAFYKQNIDAIRSMFLDCPAVRASDMGPHFRQLIRLAEERAEI